jgi:hypothetical protein
MKRLTVLLIAIVISFQCFSQDHLFVLHSLVGDTINQNEKLNYLLFRDINDSDFKYCTIIHTKDGYFVHTRRIDDSVVIKQVDSTEIGEAIVKLDKVMEYYSTQTKQDSLKNAKKLTLDFKDKDSNFKIDNIVGEDAKERIFKEVRSENRMKGDAERLELREQGTERLTGAGRIEFYKRRKK